MGIERDKAAKYRLYIQKLEAELSRWRGGDKGRWHFILKVMVTLFLSFVYFDWRCSFSSVGKEEQVSLAQMALLTASTTSLPETPSTSTLTSSIPSLAALNDAARASSAAPSGAAAGKTSLPTAGVESAVMADGKDVFEKERAELYRQLDEKV